MPTDVKWVRADLAKLIHNRKLILALYDELGIREDKYNDMKLCYEAEKVNLQDSLARRAELMKKHEWGDKIRVRRPNYDAVHACCLECGYERVAHRGKHAPDCTVDAELAGPPRGDSNGK